MSNLRPYYAFEADGNHYVYSVWGMSYRRVSVRTIEELAMIRDGQAAEPGPETVRTINELGLRWSDRVRCVADLAERDRRTVAMARETPPAIIRASLLVTQDCNMRCSYCYGDGGGYGGAGAMSEETAFRAVDWLVVQARDKKKLFMTFFGGEPLLNFGLMEKVVAYARRKAGTSRKFEFAMATNLSLLDDPTLDFLAANEFTVLASFDGPRQIQNRNRPLKNGRDSYETVLPKIQKLLDVLPGSSGRATLAAGDDPWEVARGLLAAGFRHIQIEPSSGCLITGSRAAPGTHEALIDLYRDMTSRFRQAVAGGDAREARAMSCLVNLAHHLPSFLGDRDLLRAIGKRRQYFFCGRALTRVAIAANGDIYPCHRFPGAQAFRMGNVNTGEFSRDGFLRSAVVENPECASCWARYLCGGYCQHDNAAATGDPLRHDPSACADMRARIECAIHAVDCLDGQDRRLLAELAMMKDHECKVDFQGFAQ